ncbi:MAG: HIT family protein [Alphaproteobacteria bacterium]|nr:HIT family protein [Alphaproteobacteria bacterium]
MSADPNCIFCKIVAGAIPCFKLHEDDETIAFMDINPGNDGHALAIPKAHHPDLFGLPPDRLAAVARTAQRVAIAVQKALKPDGINLVQANGKGAEQSVLHFHLHVLPRRIGDELKLNWGHRAGDMARIKANFEKIKAAM